MISALEHYAYCPRQCALIHVEQTFDENLYTLRGQRSHRRVDAPASETRSGVRIERAVPLYSDRLGLTGRADVVEFPGGTPHPVEYKHGKQRDHRPAEIQLCAQALCLEEMTGREVPDGALYFVGSNRRRDVAFDEALRAATEETVAAVRAQFEARRVPPPVNDARCPRCSLIDACMPAPTSDRRRQQRFARRLFAVED